MKTIDKKNMEVCMRKGMLKKGIVRSIVLILLSSVILMGCGKSHDDKSNRIDKENNADEQNDNIEKLHNYPANSLESEKLFNIELGSDYLHLADYHPNELSGYFSALFMYSKLYKVSAAKVPINIMDETAYELLPGDNDEEKCKSYDIVTKIIDDING